MSSRAAAPLLQVGNIMAEYPLDPQLAKMVVASPEFRWHSARLTSLALEIYPHALCGCYLEPPCRFRAGPVPSTWDWLDWEVSNCLPCCGCLQGCVPLQEFQQAAHGITSQAVLICHTQSCDYAGGRWCTSCKAAHQRASPKQNVSNTVIGQMTLPGELHG